MSHGGVHTLTFLICRPILKIIAREYGGVYQLPYIGRLILWRSVSHEDGFEILASIIDIRCGPHACTNPIE